MEQNNVKDQIDRILAKLMNVPMPDEPFTAESHLGEGGLGLGSLMIVELALDIEEHFQFRIENEDVLLIGEMTIGDLVNYVDVRVKELNP